MRYLVTYSWIKQERARNWREHDVLLSFTLNKDLTPAISAATEKLQNLGTLHPNEELILPEFLLCIGYEQLHGPGEGVRFIKRSREWTDYSNDQLHYAAIKFMNLCRLHRPAFHCDGNLSPSVLGQGIPEEIQISELDGQRVIKTSILDLSRYNYIGDLPDPLTQEQLAEQDLGNLNGKFILLPGTLDMDTQTNRITINPPEYPQLLSLRDNYTVFKLKVPERYNPDHTF